MNENSGSSKYLGHKDLKSSFPRGKLEENRIIKMGESDTVQDAGEAALRSPRLFVRRRSVHRMIHGVQNFPRNRSFDLFLLHCCISNVTDDSASFRVEATNLFTLI